eukprot:jgi/Pico_ML_1/55436/g1120.t2
MGLSHLLGGPHEKELRPAKIVKLDKLVVGTKVEMKLMHRKKGAAVATQKSGTEAEEKIEGVFPFTSTGECNRFSKYTLTNSADAVLGECLASLKASSVLLEEQTTFHQESANQLQYISIAEAALRQRVDDWLDFQGGNIRGALNVPSEHFYNDAQVDKLVARFAQSRYVVFHCMFSQQRGPFCASKFASRLGAAQLPQEPQVFILERGFSGWLSSGNLDLCENLEGS